MKINNSMQYLSGAAACAALFLVSPAAVWAAPIGARALADQARTEATIEMVASRQCSWRNGVRYCRRSAERQRIHEPKTSYGYEYGTPRPEFYPAGSTAWWHAMEREGRVFRPD